MAEDTPGETQHDDAEGPPLEELRPLGQLLSSGRPLDLTRRRPLETLVGRDLSDLVVHDSEQAGRLAGRLQAEAFAVGRRIFAPPGRLAPAVPGATQLLAHEAAHVVQQTAPARLAVGLARDLPLAPPPARREPARAAAAAPAGTADWLIQRADLAEAPGTAEEREVAAEHVARAAAASRQAAPREVDVGEVAARVYALLLQEARLEREREVGRGR